MTPVTRSSVHGNPSLPQNLSDDVYDDDMDYQDDDEDHASPQEGFPPPFQSTAQDMLQPLQDTADRVSRQVEEFAKSLDKYNASRPASDQGLWVDAWTLLDTYQDTSISRRDQTIPKSQRLNYGARERRSWGDSQAQIRRIESEAHLWSLVKDLLKCACPDAVRDATNDSEYKLGELHRYSTPSEIWNAFLDSDIAAQEYETMLAWLQDTAAETSPPIEEVVADLIVAAERGDGTWSSGPVHTIAAVKSQKVKRTWPKPLDPSNPGLKKVHVRKQDGIDLVTQLDPDAQSRQDASLQTQDEMHEEAAWRTCWEMLRRGQSLQGLEDWWNERKEIWRAMLIRAADPDIDPKSESPFIRIMNLASNSQWLAQCRQLSSKETVLYDYEAAVYGLVCGEQRISQACQSIDDNLFWIFNSLLISRYQSYLLAYKQRLSDSAKIKYASTPSSVEAIRQFCTRMLSDERNKEELNQPLKYVEMAIVSQNYDKLFIEVGQAAAHVAHTSDESAHLMEANKKYLSNAHAQLVASDQDSIRFVAHLQMLLRSLGYLERAYTDHLYDMENNIASYIGCLQRQGKFALIPLYASKLSRERMAHVLGAVLIDITDVRERELQIRLMRQYHLDLADIIYGIFSLANYSEIQRFRVSNFSLTAPRITEYAGLGKTKQIRIRSEFMNDELSKNDETCLKSAEWYRYIDADNWGRACWSISFLYKLFLFEGRFAAARELVKRANLSTTSLAAIGMNLQFSSDEENRAGNGDVAMAGSDTSVQPVLSPRKRRGVDVNHPLALPGTSRGLLASKSLVWLQLQQLVTALETLEHWQRWADEVERNRHSNAQVRAMKRDLSTALEEVIEAISPVLERDFLCQAADEAEEVVLNEIRLHYIPECVLAYNSVLYFAGHAISRSYLVQCMNLAQMVAQTPALTEVFVESGRMRELVTAFALDSQALLRANEKGSGNKGRKGKKETGTEIWQVIWRNQGPLDLEALD